MAEDKNQRTQDFKANAYQEDCALLKLMTDPNISCEDILKKFDLPADAIRVIEGPAPE